MLALLRAIAHHNQFNSPPLRTVVVGSESRISYVAAALKETEGVGQLSAVDTPILLASDTTINKQFQPIAHQPLVKVFVLKACVSKRNARVYLCS